MHRKAFTLIELLVVIAIIAILAAILFPVFAQAKLAAKKTVALSNAKEIATANFIYMGDYDDALVKEYFGFPSDCSSWGSYYYSWRYAMDPYVAKSKGLLTDPTNPFTDPAYWVDTYTDPAGAFHAYSTNFAVNNDVIGFANGHCAGPYTPEGLNSLDQLEEPAGTLVMIPNRSRWNDLKPDFISGVDEPKLPTDAANTWCIVTGAGAITCPTDPNGPINAVGKQISWVWADGHAKAKAALQTLDTTNPDRDDWASKYAICPGTGVPWTQAQRLQIAQTAWAEYK